MLCRAAILRKPREKLTIEWINLQQPKEHEVLIKLVAAAICHTDLHVIEGRLPAPMPIVLGHEGSGIVEQLGPGVQTLEQGDHVVLTLCSACGKCSYCLKGMPNLCSRALANWFMGTMLDGTRRFSTQQGGRLNHFFCLSSFSEYCVCHESAAVKVRKDLPLDVLSALGCGVSTGLGAVLNVAKVAQGSNVAVFGCGGVGLSVIMGARICGAAKIIAIDPVEEKLRAAEEFGATDTINPSREDPVRGIRKLVPDGADYCFECVGNIKVMEQAFSACSPGGTTVIIGAAPIGAKISIDPTMLLTERKLMGTLGGALNPRRDLPRYMDLYVQGKLPLQKLISHRFRLEQINESFELMRSGSLLKAILVFD